MADNSFKGVLRQMGFDVPADPKPKSVKPTKPKAKPIPKNDFQRTVEKLTGISTVNRNKPGEKSLTQLALTDPKWDEKEGKAAGRVGTRDDYQELVRTMADRDIEVFGVATLGDITKIPEAMRNHPKFAEVWEARKAMVANIKARQEQHRRKQDELRSTQRFLESGGMTEDMVAARDEFNEAQRGDFGNQVAGVAYQGLSPISALMQGAKNLGEVAGGTPINELSKPDAAAIGQAIVKDNPSAATDEGFLLDQLASAFTPFAKGLRATGQSMSEADEATRTAVTLGDIGVQIGTAALTGGVTAGLKGAGARFLIQDVPGYGQALANNGGDVQKTATQLGSMFVNGVNPNYLLDPNVPLDQKVMSFAAGAGLIYGGASTGKRMLAHPSEFFGNGVKGFVKSLTSATPDEVELASMRKMVDEVSPYADPRDVAAVERELISKGANPKYTRDTAIILTAGKQSAAELLGQAPGVTFRAPKNENTITPSQNQNPADSGVGSPPEKPVQPLVEGVDTGRVPASPEPETPALPPRSTQGADAPQGVIQAAKAANAARMAELEALRAEALANKKPRPKGVNRQGGYLDIGKETHPSDWEYLIRSIYDKVLDKIELTQDLAQSVAKAIGISGRMNKSEFEQIKLDVEAIGRSYPEAYDAIVPRGTSGGGEIIPPSGGKGAIVRADKGEGGVKGPFRNYADVMDELLRNRVSKVNQVTGETDIQGSYERRGGSDGRWVSDRFVDASREISNTTNRYADDIARIEGILRAAASERGEKAGLSGVPESTSREFVDLVELPFKDQRRIDAINKGDAMGKAIAAHDGLMEEIRGLIIDSRRAYGIDTPDDWGIRDRGYFPHTFEGNSMLYEVMPNGARVNLGEKGPFMNRADAEALATKLKDADPSRSFEIVDRSPDTPKRRGIRKKLNPHAMERKGVEGYLKESYADTVSRYATSVIQKELLNKFAATVKPKIDEIAKTNLSLAELMRKDVGQIMNPNGWLERGVANLIKNSKKLDGLITNPDDWMRSLIGFNGSLQYNTRIRFKPSAWAAQGAQSSLTILPETTIGRFYGTVVAAARKDVREALRDAGVLGGANKYNLTPEAVSVRPRAGKLDPFSAGSDYNRAIGYVFGWEKAMREQGVPIGFDEWISKRGSSTPQIGNVPPSTVKGQGYAEYTEGMSDAEIRAHNNGLEWAGRAEGEMTPFTNIGILNKQALKPFTQFKGFQKFALDDIFAPRMGDTAGRYWGRVIKKGAVMGGVGGAKAVTPTPLKGLLLYWAYNTHKMWRESLMKENPEMSQEDADDQAEQIVNTILHGFPGLIGLDFSTSTSLLDLYGRDSGDKVLSFFGGPFLSSVLGIADAIGATLRGDLSGWGKGLADQMSPVKGIVRASGAKSGVNKNNRPAFLDKAASANVTESKRFEQLMSLLGFNTIESGKEWAQKDRESVGKARESFKKLPSTIKKFPKEIEREANKFLRP